MGEEDTSDYQYSEAKRAGATRVPTVAAVFNAMILIGALQFISSAAVPATPPSPEHGRRRLVMLPKQYIWLDYRDHSAIRTSGTFLLGQDRRG